MKKKVFIIRDIDVSYINHLGNGMNDQELENHLTTEYGSYGFTICAMTPIYNEENKIVAYKTFFVRDDDEENEE